VDRLYAQDDPAGLSQTRCLGELNERLLPKDAIVIGASGSLPGISAGLAAAAADAYHMEYGFLLHGLRDRRGAGREMAAPNREVFALVGDGSYVMLHSELLTSIMEGLKINVVVFDNNGFQCIDNLQVSQGIAKYGNEWRRRDPKTGLLTGDPVPIDFARNGESYGARGFAVRTIVSCATAVRQALRESARPSLTSRSTEVDDRGIRGLVESGDGQVSRNRKVVGRQPSAKGRSRQGQENLTSPTLADRRCRLRGNARQAASAVLRRPYAPAPRRQRMKARFLPHGMTASSAGCSQASPSHGPPHPDSSKWVGPKGWPGMSGEGNARVLALTNTKSF